MNLKNQDQLINLAKVLGVLMIALGVVALIPETGVFILSIFAIALFFSGMRALRQYKDADKWIESLATVLKIEECSEEVAEQKYSATTYYYPKITYEYLYENTKYKNSKVSFEKKNMWKSKETAWGYETPKQTWWWQKLSIGDKLKVFINPEDYSDSVLIKDVSKRRKSHHLALVVSGVLLGLICVLLFWSNLTSE